MCSKCVGLFSAAVVLVGQHASGDTPLQLVQYLPLASFAYTVFCTVFQRDSDCLLFLVLSNPL